MAKISKPFPSKFPGKCANTSCPLGGAVSVGQLIRWSRGQRPAKVWHDGFCYDTRYISLSNNGAVSPINSNSNNGAVSADIGSTQRMDQDVVSSQSLRSQGPLFDMAGPTIDVAPVVDRVTKPPVAVAHNGAHSASNGVSQSSADIWGPLAGALAPYLETRLQSALRGTVDETKVLELIQKALGSAILKTVTQVEIFDHVRGDVQDLGLQHHLFPRLLNRCSARLSDGFRLNIWLTGPAGSGKTTAAKNVARALSLKYYFTGSIDTEYKLMGFIDAQGRIVNTQFRQAYEHGGVFLFDEVDASFPGALLAFNAALANGEAAFPDAIVPRHADFVCIAAANTWGLGAVSDYVGRLKLDGAFLDRFIQIHWDIDPALELATCTHPTWVKRVQALRAAAIQKGIKVIISPRASYFGAALLSAGAPLSEVEEETVRKAMSADQWNSIKGAGL